MFNLMIVTHKNKDRHEVISGRNWLVLGEAEKVHDHGGDPGDAPHLVLGHLEGCQPPQLSLHKDDKKKSTKTILYLSSRPGTLVLISPGYLEVSVTRSDDAGESGDVLLQHLVPVQVCLLVRMQRKHVELREDHPLHSFPIQKIFKTMLTLCFAR